MDPNTLNQIIRGLPQEVKAAIAKDAIDNQKSVQPLPYWSVVSCQFTRTGAGPYTWTLSTTDRKAFQYAVGGDMSVAGFASGTIATGAETNLQVQGQTLSNADVYIYGLAAELTPDSDPDLAALVWRNTFLELSLNGQESVKIGTLNMFPQAGGLKGFGRSSMRAPSLIEAGFSSDGGPGAQFSALMNGEALAGNFYRFPQPYIWRKVGSGKDSSLSITLKTPNAITTTTTDRAAVAGAAPGASGRVEPYTSPSGTARTRGTYVDIRFRLVSMSVGDRSINF